MGVDAGFLNGVVRIMMFFDDKPQHAGNILRSKVIRTWPVGVSSHLKSILTPGS